MMDCILFDVDGVLVDVRRSYLETIAQTAQFYLERILGLKPMRQKLLTVDEVEAFKGFGGLNNDWDCTFALIAFLLTQVDSSLSANAIRRKIQKTGLKPNPRLLKQILSRVRHPEKDKGVSYPLVQRLFQERYLGSRLFRAHYGQAPQYVKGEGTYKREKLLMPKSVLETLKKKKKTLGVVTGRNRFEAEHVLRHFGIARFFRVVVTADEVFREEEKQFRKTGRRPFLGKPHPFSLLKAAQTVGLKKRFLYVGDLPDDILTAHAARRTLKIQSAGLLAGTNTPRAFQKQFARLRADYILKRPQELLALL